MYYVLCNTASSRARRRASAVPNTPTHTWAVAAALIPGMADDEDKSGVTKFGLLHHELK